MIEEENAAKEVIRPYIRISNSCGKADNFGYYIPENKDVPINIKSE